MTKYDSMFYVPENEFNRGMSDKDKAKFLKKLKFGKPVYTLEFEIALEDVCWTVERHAPGLQIIDLVGILFGFVERDGLFYGLKDSTQWKEKGNPDYINIRKYELLHKLCYKISNKLHHAVNIVIREE